jgi:acid phosphatase class B
MQTVNLNQHCNEKAIEKEAAKMTYSMTCSCGDVMTIQGNTREEAVKNLKSLMDEKAVNAHMAQKHPGEKAPTVKQVHTMIEQGLKAAA